MNSGVALINECIWAESEGLKPVILYCGDLDPMGVKMSDAILENLMPLAKVLDWGWELEEMANDDQIVRFGLNAEFVDNAGLLWIDGSETSSASEPFEHKHLGQGFGLTINCFAYSFQYKQSIDRTKE